MSHDHDFTISAAAVQTGYTRGRLYQMIDEGTLPVRRVKVMTHEYRLPRASVEELAAQRRRYEARRRAT